MMLKKIVSVLTLILLTAGITIYGYDCEIRSAAVLAQEDTLSSAEADADVSVPDAVDTAYDTAVSDPDDTLRETSDAAPGTDALSADESIPEDPDPLPAEDVKDDSGVDMTKVTAFPEPRTMYVQSPVNVRSGPDTSYDRIGFVNQNEELTILGQYENNGWYHFLYHDEDAFVSNLYIGETMVEPAESLTESTSSADAAPPEPAQAPAPQPEPAQPEPAPAPQPAAAAGVLFIGDSRCVQMKEAVAGGGCTWICENSKGYNWLIENALAKADNVVGKGTKVVMCLGVNDTRNCSNYAAIMNQKAAEWAGRGARTYFVSVNPVWENPYTSEEQVENFNASIAGQLSGITWIDTHSWLTANGYRLVDGLHYDTNTYINIFNVIIGSL